MEALTFELPGHRVAALAWGREDGPLALCLHGFPDTAWSWAPVAQRLADDGWRVVAPFSRGYAPTDLAPDGNYQAGALVRDALAVRAAAGGGAGSLLIGHDWGALTAYGVADYAPEAFARIVTMAVPPIAAYRRAMTDGRAGALLALRQLRCSWYMVAHQLPRLSERAFEPLVRKLWADWSPGYDGTEAIGHLLDAMPDRAHRRAAIDYYRAAFQPWRLSRRYEDEQAAALRAPIAPTLYLHGERDGCVLPEVGAYAADALPPDSTVTVVPDAGHFLQLEAPDAVAGQIREYLRRLE